MRPPFANWIDDPNSPDYDTDIDAFEEAVLHSRHLYADSFTEELHARVPAGQGGGGRFGTVGTGVASPKSRAAVKALGGRSHAPLGKGYSETAHLVNGVIHTDNVYDAVLALTQDRAVELKQPKQVSTLIKALGEVTKNMIDEGEKAPSFDLCKVTVKGTNLFCADTKGIPRIKMPQMDDDQTKQFIKHLKGLGFKSEKDEVRSENLRATQSQLDGAKVYKFYKRIVKDPDYLGDDKRLVVSNDDYVLDGHHHWAAQIAADAKDNKLGDHHTRVYRVDIPIIPLYKLAMKFTGGKGAKGVKDAGAWNEEAHTRGQPGNAGQFGPGGSGSSAKEKSARAVRALSPAGAHSLTPEGAESDRQRAAAALAALAPKAEKKLAKKEDFDKAKIRLGSSNSDAVVRRWNEKIGIEPEQFKQEFLGGIDATMSIDTDGSKFLINGEINGIGANAGMNIGTYTRHLDPDHQYAYSAYFKLNKGVQHGDIGKQMLAGNVATYEKLGIETVGVTANINIGGYAWAKYGYVPTPAAWSTLSRTLERKVTGGRSRGLGGHDNDLRRNGEQADEWSYLSEDTQTEVRDRWKRDTHSEFVDSEIENWRDSGQPLNDAKNALAENFNDSRGNIPEWANDALNTVRDERGEDTGDEKMPPIPLTNQQLHDALSVDYSSRYDDGRGDPDFSWDDKKLATMLDPATGQKTLPGIEPPDYSKLLTQEMRDHIEERLSLGFNDRAESDASDIDAPDYINDSVSEYQADYWEQMDDAQRLEHAERYDLNYFEVPEDDEEKKDKENKSGEQKVLELAPQPSKQEVDDAELLKLIRSPNPKAIWAISDTPRGKELLLGENWAGKLNLKDPEAYARFKDYVGRKKEKPSAAA